MLGSIVSDFSRTVCNASTSKPSIRIRRSISISREGPIGLLFHLTVSKLENISDSSFEQDRMLVMLAFVVFLRPRIDLSWTALLSKYKSSGFPLVFRLSSAWMDRRRDKIRGSSSVTI